MKMSRTMLRTGLIALFALVLGVVGGAAAHAQDQDGVQRNPPVDDRPDPTQRTRTDQETIKAQRNMKNELKGSYKTWVDQDVKWIITDEELSAFKHLSNDEERDAFIESFWQRRNPNPDSPDNEFRAQTAGISTLHSASRIRSTRTLAAETTSGRLKKAAAIHPHSHSRSGTTGTSRASATTSISSLSTRASAATTT
jgi:hypothetical protein